MEYEKLRRKGREQYLDKVVLGRQGYIRQGLLGQGSFSDVYCVEDIASGSRYTCKISWQVQMLEREAQVLQGIRHPLFPKFMAFWREAELGILLREYVEGCSLEEMLEQQCFSALQTVQMGRLLADGLLYLHELPQRLLFRDVKPANVIIGQNGKAKLIDFGCVCSMATEVSSRAGSPGFAPPEQLQEGGLLTAACDVYGLGKTLEAMLGEKPPGWRYTCNQNDGRGQENPWSVRGQRRLERKLRHVLKACTKEDAQKRIADMKCLIQKLDRLSGGSTGTQRAFIRRIPSKEP